MVQCKDLLTFKNMLSTLERGVGHLAIHGRLRPIIIAVVAAVLLVVSRWISRRYLSSASKSAPPRRRLSDVPLTEQADEDNSIAREADLPKSALKTVTFRVGDVAPAIKTPRKRTAVIVVDNAAAGGSELQAVSPTPPASSVDNSGDELATPPAEMEQSSASTAQTIGGSRSKKSHSSRRSKRSGDDEPRPDSTLPDFIMLMGIPGSGKSTWAKDYTFKIDASFTIVSSDEIRKRIAGSVNDQSKNAEVWETVLNQVVGLLKQDRNVILDATNVRSDQRRVFVSQLPPCNKFMKVFPVLKAIARNRITKEVAAGADRADVPDSILEKMHASFTESMTVIRSEGWIMKP